MGNESESNQKALLVQRPLLGNVDLQVIDSVQWVWAWLVYLAALGVKGVTTESVQGRGEVEVRPEGESKEGGTDRGGEVVREREMKE